MLRYLYAWNFRIDSDEPQHLHVVWAWANGLLPYRDVFDNHAPLFQALCAPLFHLFGERADIIMLMRLGLIPVFALTIACVWKAGAALFSHRTALWTALLAALLPPFFLTSVEFRPDQLWTLIWLGLLTVVAVGPLTLRRAFAVGLLLGAAFSVSLKSVLMLVALGVGFAGACLFALCAGRPVPWKHLGKCALAGLAGVAAVPALVACFFLVRHAGGGMYYCLVTHNIVPRPGKSYFWYHVRSWVLLTACLPPVVALIARLERPFSIRVRIVFLFLASALYYITLRCFWPVLTAEDYIPLFPALMMTAGPACVWGCGALAKKTKIPQAILLGSVVLMEAALLLKTQSPLDNQTADKVGIVENVLKLTQRNEFVMDSKGETIFRPRPFWFVLEKFSLKHLKRGMITDDIPERLIATRTPVATLTRMPFRDQKFITANYLPIAFRLYALGKLLQTSDSQSYCFDIAIPGRYTLVGQTGSPAGVLDGMPFTGPRELAAGHHEFRSAAKIQPLAVIWGRAAEQGFSPFAAIKPDYKSAQD